MSFGYIITIYKLFLLKKQVKDKILQYIKKKYINFWNLNFFYCKLKQYFITKIHLEIGFFILID